VEPKTYFPKFCHRLAQCKYCPKINKKDLVITNANRKFHSKYQPKISTIFCELKNVIYCITCRTCKMQYIGETSRPIRQRIYEHLYSITKGGTKPTPVSRHFHPAHYSPNDLSFTIIEDCNLLKCNNDPDTLRKRRELFWIWALKTAHPYGINMAL
jgi:arginyl-tRNA--protein-N-Asp/Glu arginylyltransferase